MVALEIGEMICLKFLIDTLRQEILVTGNNEKLGKNFISGREALNDRKLLCSITCAAH